MNQEVDSQTVRIADLVDEQKIGPFIWTVVFIGFLCQLCDGYDLSAAAFAAIGIANEFGLERHALAPLFSVGLFGMLFGALGFGYIGDRWGRRVAVLSSALLCSVFTLLSATAHSFAMLLVFRFFTGIALGGLPANTVALTAEYAPQRKRSLLITIMFVGLTFGGALPGQLGSIIHPTQWRLIFTIGGLAPLVTVVLAGFFLPESIKFLAVRNAHDPQIVKLARRIRPELNIPVGTRFQILHLAEKKFHVSQLFEGNLRIITPLIWVMSITTLFANFFMNSWMPTLLHSLGLDPHQAEHAASMYYLGGVLGGLMMSLMLDRGRLWVVPLYMALGAAAALFLGQQTHSMALALGVFGVGLFILGTQSGTNALMAVCYPTQIRASGTGWAHGLGRFGAIAGPMTGGELIHMRLHMAQIFWAPAIVSVVGCVATIWLSRAARDRFPTK
ncbi:MFS transporter [Paraburkholderia edwinii]|uniref:MFS transporter n=1 Tax=Paraburkholderia edwinii TaxID=2861782 RepID=A0ABX8UWI9_9BURK|nr:MFS transporter [Paraburkholderia edwinii]QYD73241.1 MFS transporter [Paraburkholderia edwinii]